MNYYISDKIRAVDGEAINRLFRASADPTCICLAAGNPSPELFPSEQLADLAQEILRENPVLALQYNMTAGYTPFREAIMARAKRVEGIGQPFDQCVVTCGGQQGADIIAKIAAEPGDVVLVEEPSYVGTLNTFRSHGLKLVGVPTDENGLIPEGLEKVLQETDRVRFLYTIPTFQNPAGTTVPVERRKQIYEIAKRYNLLILEDNPYGELRFHGEWVPTFKSMDTEGLVVYVSSFSKILAPGLRLGYLILHETLAERAIVAKQCSDVHTPMLIQLMAMRFMERYDMDAMIKEMSAMYKHKCQVMIDAMKECFPEWVTWVEPQGGLFVWCDLGEGFDAYEVSEICAKQKVAFVPGNAFMTDMSKPCSNFRLNFSTMSDEKIREGVAILGRALHGLK